MSAIRTPVAQTGREKKKIGRIHLLQDVLQHRCIPTKPSSNRAPARVVTMRNRYRSLAAIAAMLAFVTLPASAQTIYVDDGAGTDVGGCGASTGAAACASIQYAIDTIASGGETLEVAAGTYDENVVVSKSLTINGVKAGVATSGRTVGVGETIVKPTGGTYGFSIGASSVTIDGFDIDGSASGGSVWAGVQMFGAYTGTGINWNFIHGIDGINPSSNRGDGATIKYSYGIWTMGGGSTGSRGAISGLTIAGNKIFDIGDGAATGGAGMYLKSLSGASAGAGATIQSNILDDLKTGPTEVFTVSAISVTYVYNGVGVAVLQDDDTGSSDSGVQIGGNTSGQGNSYGPTADAKIGVVAQTSSSSVDEDNANFGSFVDLLVVNQPLVANTLLATIDEDQLAPFAKTDNLALLSGVGIGGTVGYFADLADAVTNSATGASIELGPADTGGGAPLSGAVTIAAGIITFDFGGGNTFTVSKAALEAAGIPLTIAGTDGDDSVTVDPDAIPSTGMIYNGGSGNDELTISDPAGGLVSYTHIPDTGCTEPECGDFTFDTGAMLTYTGLEPVTDLTVLASKTFTLTAADETITIVPDPAAATRTLIDSGTMESVSFVNPTATLTVNAGAGDDTIDFDGLGTSNAGTITTVELNGDAGEDALVIDPLDSAVFTAIASFAADGGAPTVCQGDLIDFVLAGGQTVTFAPHPPDDGTATFATPADVTVTYASFERFEDKEADLELTSVVLTDDTLFPGDDSIVTIVITNNGAHASYCLQVDLSSFPGLINTDDDNSSVLPAHTVTSGTFDETTKIWSIDALASAGTATLTLPFVVDTILSGDFQIPATVASSNMDPDATNNAEDDTLSVGTPFKFPPKAHSQSVVFKTLDSGLERMILGLYLGSPGINGAVWCRVPSPDGDVFTVVVGFGATYKTCSTGLPAVSGVALPLYVNDLWLDETGTNAGRIYMSTWGSDGLYFSDDDGESWTAMEPDLGDGFGGSSGWLNVYAITEDATDGILYISANNGLVFRSLNNGTTWQQVSSLPEGAADTPWSLVSHPVTSGVLYAGTLGKGVYVSTDYGLSWAQIDDNSSLVAAKAGYIFDLEVRRAPGPVDYIYAATSRGVWRKDLDPLASWEELDTDQGAITPTGLNPEVRSIEFGADIDGDAQPDLYAVTWGFGVYKHATPYDAVLTVSDLNAFALRGMEVTVFAVSPSGTLFAGTSDGAFYEMDPTNPVQGTATATEPDAEGLPTGYALDANYPNPFNPVTTVGFDVPETAQVRVTVFDILGREVAVLADGLLQAGRHEVQFDASGLPSGTYLYRLQAPGLRITRQMVLVK
jgi:Domain of unknown function DUF11/Secretion system C-terminal sorting domain